MDGRPAHRASMEVLRAEARVTNEAALWAIPQYHIVCTSTLATRDPELMAKARDEDRLWDIDTGHDLMITEPEAVAELLERVASDSDRSTDAAR